MGGRNGKHSSSRMGYGMGETLMERGRDPWALGKGTGEAPLDHNGNKSDSWSAGRLLVARGGGGGHRP